MIEDPKKNLSLWKMILLENQSTVDIFFNSALLYKVWDSGEKITVRGNSGKMTTTMKATIKKYG